MLKIEQKWKKENGVILWSDKQIILKFLWKLKWNIISNSENLISNVIWSKKEKKAVF